MISEHAFSKSTDAPADCCGIYAIRHIATGLTYVGQVGGTRSFRRRCQEHHYNAINSVCQHRANRFGRAVRKYGPDSFSFHVLEVIEGKAPNDIFDAAEMKWVLHFGSLGSNGYNIHMGPNPRGVKRSEETRRRMSESRKLMLASRPDVADSLRQRLKERNRTSAARIASSVTGSNPAIRAKMSESIRATMASPERQEARRLREESRHAERLARKAVIADERERRKISRLHQREIDKKSRVRAQRRGCAVVRVDTGENFASINAAARSIGVTGVALLRHVRGESRTCKGLYFEYVSDAA